MLEGKPMCCPPVLCYSLVSPLRVWTVREVHWSRPVSDFGHFDVAIRLQMDKAYTWAVLWSPEKDCVVAEYCQTQNSQ